MVSGPSRWSGFATQLPQERRRALPQPADGDAAIRGRERRQVPRMPRTGDVDQRSHFARSTFRMASESRL